jgi:hypothetical protein
MTYHQPIFNQSIDRFIKSSQCNRLHKKIQFLCNWFVSQRICLWCCKIVSVCKWERKWMCMIRYYLLRSPHKEFHEWFVVIDCQQDTNSWRPKDDTTPPITQWLIIKWESTQPHSFQVKKCLFIKTKSTCHWDAELSNRTINLLKSPTGMNSNS